ncbi:MAG TPA: hypothetical protein VF678_14330 [bacterium]
MGLFVLALSACSPIVVYQPYETAMINKRSTLMLDATPQAPLTDADAQRYIDKLEARLLASPYIGQATSRAQFRLGNSANFKVLDDYGVLSDNLSVVGLADREQTARLGKATGREFLLGVQVFSVPCDQCTEGDQVGAVGQMYDAKTGQLVWRVTLLKSVERKPASVAAGIEALSDQLVEVFNDALRPKWHRIRFANLNATRASQPRADIPMATEGHSGEVRIQTGTPYNDVPDR